MSENIVIVQDANQDDIGTVSFFNALDIGNVNHAKPLPSRDQIVALQNLMFDHQCEIPDPIHRFAPGMYMRELTVPAGMLIVGKIHKHAHFLMVLSGLAEVVSEFGREVVEAGHISISPAGVKRAIVALEDTRFITIHVNKDDCEDVAVIEAEHIEYEIPVKQLKNTEVLL